MGLQCQVEEQGTRWEEVRICETMASLALSKLGREAKHHRQGLSAAAWHSPSFPVAGGHVGGRKEGGREAQESSLCRSTFS